MIKQVYRVKKDGRLNKNSDLTLDKGKPIVEEQSDSSISKIVPNDDPDNVVKQCSSSAGGQDKSNHIGSDRTGLTGLSDRSDRSEPRKSGSAKNRTKPTFEVLLDKYKMFEQKQSNQLEGKQRRNSSPPRSRKHQRSLYWYSSFIQSMHVPWNAYSGISNYNPWFEHNPWLPCYDYQFYALPRNHDLNNQPHWPCQDL